MPATDFISYVIAGGASLVICAAAIAFFLRTNLAQAIVDTPNDRSSHTQPTPRFGGLCLMLSALVVAAFFVSNDFHALLAVGACLSILSFLDDVWSLPVIARLGAHMAAALALVLLYPTESIAIQILVFLFTVWMTNLYNFMDGIDGLAGGMTAIGFGAFAMAAYFAGAMSLGILSTCIAAASVGFLAFNFPPAKIFMGDSGSIALGFLAAAISYVGWQRGAWDMWFGPFVFSPFVLDATLTLFRRLFGRERIWQAHRSHYYQRMTQMGGGHRQTTLRWYALMLGVAGSALACRNAGAGTVTLLVAGWAALFLLGALWVDRASAMELRNERR